MRRRAPSSCGSSEARTATSTRPRFAWGTHTYVFAVLNVTPDSFSGDGIAGDVPRALSQAERMLADGADVIDVGGESTRPGHEPVSAAEELRRVEPVLRALAERAIPVSIDTRKAAVARAALALGARVVNDVSGFADPEMANVVAASEADVVLMEGSDVRGSADPVGLVMSGLERLVREAQAAGIARSRIVIDPGFGFGKGPRENLLVLGQLRRLCALGLPILIGTSRKSTLGVVLGGAPVDERLEATAATVALAIANGADAVRVHDVQEMSRVARVADAVVRGWRG
jgi:dihydropteroate synthase